MHFDLAAIPQSDAYKLLVSTVVPRPIALATTVDRAGRVNAAPFSFFNAVSSVPPIVVLGISPGAGDPNGPSDGYKDTERNIRDTGEFVVNLVDEALAERMNICAVDFPSAIGELEKAGLTPVPSVGVRAPRIASRRSASNASGSPGCRSARARRSRSGGSSISTSATIWSTPNAIMSRPTRCAWLAACTAAAGMRAPAISF